MTASSLLLRGPTARRFVPELTLSSFECARLGHTLTDLCQLDILQSGLGCQGTECNPIGTYDVLIAGQAMAPPPPGCASGSSFAWIEIAPPPEHARGKAVVIDPCLPFGRAVQQTAQGTPEEQT